MGFNYFFEHPKLNNGDFYARFGDFLEFKVRKLLRQKDGLPNGVEGFVPVSNRSQSLTSVISPYICAPGNRIPFQLSYPREVWKFPHERFVTYEPKDELWCCKLGIGGRKIVRDLIDAEVAVQSFDFSFYDRFTGLLTVSFDLCVWTPATLTIAS